MIYQNYQLMANLGNPVRLFANQASAFLDTWQAVRGVPASRRMTAWLEQVSLFGFTHHRPPFRIEPVTLLSGESVGVDESMVAQTPFCRLIRFSRQGARGLPRVMLVAPMSGHFATLLRATVQTLVQDHEVYLTDWLNIRDVPLSAGEFDMDVHTEQIIHFLHLLGPRTHLIGVCQPTVSCLAAASLMAEDKNDCVPASITLMAGPVDPRISPTKVNQLAMSKPIEWFENNLIGEVPLQFAGHGRRVYPGFVQLTAFLSMNAERHRKSFNDLFTLRAAGEDDKADAIREFYGEYFAIMDLAAPFYLQTVERIFQQHLLPKGELTFRGRPVRPQALRKTFVLTVEGERDDICGIGQTLAAQDLCSRVPAWMKTHHLQAGVGHYGVFSGKRWSAQIYPVVRAMIQNA